MATPVVMPRAGTSVESCLIVSWLKKPGDKVGAGEIICEIETDKATMEVESPAPGVLLEIFFPEDSDVPVMTNIAAIGEPGEDVSGLRPGGTQAKPVLQQGPVTEDKSESKPVQDKELPPLQGGQVTNLAISPRARLLADRERLEVSSVRGSGPHGRIIEKDVKAASEALPRLSLAAHEAVKEAGLVATEFGTGLGGMVLHGDLKKAQAAEKAQLAPQPAAVEVSVKGIRKIIAERMRHSLNSSAQLTLHAYAKADQIQSYRQAVKSQGKQYGVPDITINDMIVFAVSRVLAQHQQLNAHFLGDKIVQYPYVNIGIAVDTDRGLMVPVVNSVQNMTISEVSQAIKTLAKSCQDGTVNPDLLKGSTFTITNLGAAGVDYFTPVLNVPEVAILGVGGILLRPVQGSNGIEFVPTISLSLTIDHQAVDGAPGARFLKEVVSAIENFSILLS